ncbi:unnamed protein product [Hymenolepis diminuta]|uniref:Secreted protein n=1 Tax=Hymenolepis diminuta TaxID=6216 RepID=A0A0R3SKS9_HYMDI|nr:unnamed protein product [Hymenolepis diminuta]
MGRCILVMCFPTYFKCSLLFSNSLSATAAMAILFCFPTSPCRRHRCHQSELLCTAILSHSDSKSASFYAVAE